MRGFIKIIILFFLMLFALEASSQSFSNFYTENKTPKDTAKFSLHVNNTNFLKNNEFFNHFANGYTLIGYFLQPNFQFRANDKLSLFAGIHLQKYSGIEQFTEAIPTFTLQYKPGDKTTILFGNINSTLNHDLNDYIYAEEYYLTDNIENGLQILHTGERFNSDTWVDWKQFIFNGSEYPEILVLGTSNTLTILKSKHRPSFNKARLNLRFGGVACHEGGQIDASDVPVETITNTITGVDLFMYPNRKICKKVRVFSHFHTSYDASPEKRLNYLYGYGVLSGIELTNKNFDIRIEQWFGEYYFSKFGSPLYQSITPKYTSYFEDQRAFAIAHLFYRNESVENLKIGLGLDFYYNILDQHLDYSFGFYLKSSFRFNLKRNSKK